MNRQQRRAERQRYVPVPARRTLPGAQGLFEDAFRCHQAGYLNEAATAYRRVLDLMPDHLEARFYLGNVLHQAGQPASAAECFRRVLELRPDMAEAHYNLGNALKSVNRFAEAADSYRTAIALALDLPAVHNNLGNVLKELGRLDEAVACFSRVLAAHPHDPNVRNNMGTALRMLGRTDEAIANFALAIEAQPDHPDAHYNLGAVLQDRGRFDEAIACYRRAIRIRPEFSEAHSNMGIAFGALGRLDEAVACHRLAVQFGPLSADAHYNLGTTLLERKRFDEAAACHRRAIDLKPDHPEAHNNLGTALGGLGRWDDAVACHRRAIALKPDYPEAHTNLGLLLCDLGRLDEAIASHRQAIRIKPDYPEGHDNLGHALLLDGEYPEGWKELEWRFRKKDSPPRPFTQPRWTGEDLRGRRLLIWGEQGVGDELLFFAFLPELLDRGAELVVECDPRLVPMLGRALPGVEAVARKNPPDRRCLADDIDFQIPAVSVGALLRPTSADFRPLSPYLRPDPGLVKELRHRYGGDQGVPLVGISWWSQNDPKSNTSFSLPQWRPILEVPGLRFVSVQYGNHRAEIEATSRELSVPILCDDTVDPLTDLDRTSAQIAALDLTVTMQNSTVHLAALTGRPAYLLTPFVPDWWTGLSGHRSPWDPGAVLFRQQRPDDWPATIERVAASLRQWAEAAPETLKAG